MESRSAARELALLALFQLPKNPEKLAKTDLQAICLAAVRSLADMAKENIKQAEAFFVQTERFLLEYKTDHPDNEKYMEAVADVPVPKTDKFGDHIDNCYQSIAFMKEALRIPELYWHYNDEDVKEFTLHLVQNYINHKEEVDTLIKETSSSWDMDRIHKIDKSILRLSVAEILHTETPASVIASEAIKIASKYSGEEGSKFVNGVLRDVVEHLTHH